MTKITKIDKNSANALSSAIEAALAQVAADHGVTIKAFGGTINSDSEFVAKLKIRLSDPAAVEAAARKEFETYAPMLGIPVDIFGKEATVLGERYRVTGIAPSRSKNVLRIRRLRDNSDRIAPAIWADYFAKAA